MTKVIYELIVVIHILNQKRPRKLTFS